MNVDCCKVALKICNKLVTNLCYSGHQPTRPTLLKRKRTTSEDEVGYHGAEFSSEANSCSPSLIPCIL